MDAWRFKQSTIESFRYGLMQGLYLKGWSRRTAEKRHNVAQQFHMRGGNRFAWSACNHHKHRGHCPGVFFAFVASFVNENEALQLCIQGP